MLLSFRHCSIAELSTVQTPDRTTPGPSNRYVSAYFHSEPHNDSPWQKSSASLEKNPLSRPFDLAEYRLQLGLYGAQTLYLVVSDRVSQARGGPVAGFFEQGTSSLLFSKSY
jgi:hypothetical protein